MIINIKSLFKKFIVFRQLESSDCAPTCLKMLAKHYGKNIDIHYLRKICHINKNGVSLLDLIDASENIGFDTAAVKLSIDDLSNNIPTPCILHWKENHYVVFLRKIKNNYFVIADPAYGIQKLHEEEFLNSWKIDSQSKGVALLLEPSDSFTKDEIKTAETFNQKKYFLNYLKPFKYKFLILSIIIITIASISALYPSINERLVDIGIKNDNIKYVLFLLSAQLILYTSSNLMSFLQGYIFLNINTKLSINIISDFLKKLILMPLSFFDSKLSTDIMLRVDDHSRIEDFFSNHSLQFFISIIIFIIYSILLINYSSLIFLFFIFFSIISILWVYFLNKQRQFIDYKRFEIESENRNILYEIINGVSDLKINNASLYKSIEWEKTERKKYTLNKQSMLLELKQSIGVNYLSQFKNTIIIAYVALCVINEELTIGALLSISFIIGQLSLPIEAFIMYLYSYQDAKISIDRLLDVYRKKDEEQDFLEKKENTQKELKDNYLKLSNAKFTYFGPNSHPLFQNLNIEFPINKVSAIVGTSGSGKTTIIKLLLKYYKLLEGDIFYQGQNIENISPEKWRSLISIVFQDGFIFSDTIVNNILLGSSLDEKKINQVIILSNCSEFVYNLPQREHTKVGANGIGLSKGQIQRILIARAMYKDPKIIILDEATSALDSENEKIIHNNLQNFFKGRTVIIIAHRLSTVKNADKIIVLNQGEVIEEGTHKDLVLLKKEYYNLVKNQLELGD